ncbi:MAG: hypothetical protein ACI89U_003391 [Gammaproteobacteria bacterium]
MPDVNALNANTVTKAINLIGVISLGKNGINI